MASSLDLEPLFNPRQVALLGVSRDPHRDSNAYLRVLTDGGYQGRISVLGAADYGAAEPIDSLDALPEGIDVVFTLLRPALAEESLLAAARRGAKFGVVFAGGFAEAGADGDAAQRRIVEACAPYGMRIVGPNCMGLFNTWASVNLSEIADVPRGHIGLVSQSGNNGITMVHEATRYGSGLSSFVSFGNQADLPAHTYIDHLGSDPNTEVIALYLEGLREGDADAFIETCRRVAVHTPIVALKGGRGTAGSRAAASHTASLAKLPRAYSALFRQAGILEVDHLEDLFPAAQALVDSPPLRGDRIAIVGSGGGHSTVAADEIEAAGLSAPGFSSGLQSSLAERLPFGSPVGNPIDMTGAYLKDANLFSELAKEVLDQDDYDGVVCYGLYGPDHWPATVPDPTIPDTEAGPALARLKEKSGKPVTFFTIYADQNHPHVARLRESGIPTFPNMRTVAAVMRILRERGRAVFHQEVQASAGVAVGSAVTTTDQLGAPVALDEDASLRLLREAGIPTPTRIMASSPAAVARALEEIGATSVVKGVLSGVAHKSELGAVKLGVATPSDAVRAAEEIAASVAAHGVSERLQGFLVAEDLGRGRELIAGIKRDPVLGNIGLLGLGGIYAEQLDDVALGILPLDVDAVKSLVGSLDAAAYFGAVRGQSAVDTNGLTALFDALSGLLIARPEIESIDINPLIVRSDGSIVVADAAVHLRS